MNFMRRNLLLIVSVFVSSGVFAQSPAKVTIN